MIISLPVYRVRKYSKQNGSPKDKLKFQHQQNISSKLLVIFAFAVGLCEVSERFIPCDDVHFCRSVSDIGYRLYNRVQVMPEKVCYGVRQSYK